MTALKLPANATIVLPAGTENKMTARNVSNDIGASYGVWGAGNITVTSVGDIAVEGVGALAGVGGDTANYLSSIGVFANGTITVSDGGKLIGVGGSTPGTSCGIYATELSVGGTSAVEGQGGSAENSFGVRCEGLSVSGSAKLTGIGGSATSISCGMDFNMNRGNITGGTVIASTGTAISPLAFSNSPSLGGYATYYWRTSKTGAYTEKSAGAFPSGVTAYAEIRPNLTDVVPKLANIAAPAPIEPNGTLNLPTPTVTESVASSPVAETGYQLSNDNFATFELVTASTPIPYAKNGYLLRAFAVNIAGRGYSNAVAITVNAPVALTVDVTPASSFMQGNAPALRLTIGGNVATGFGVGNLDSVTVTVNGTPMPLAQGTHYSASTGSILIDLHQSWLNTLQPGNYPVDVLLKGGAYAGMHVYTRFTVATPGGGAGDSGAGVPKTGDTATPLLWLGLATLAGAGLMRARRKKRG